MSCITEAVCQLNLVSQECGRQGKISVKALRTNDTWYGMTYKEDVAAVKESFSKMLENGTYKGDLFSDL